MSGIYIALGSNLGDRRANLARALELLEPQVSVEAVSPIYESKPQSPAPPPAYLNAVCLVTTALEPHALLTHLKAIEGKMGRRAAERWAPRIIDLDLILYNDEIIETPTLTVPHPRMHEREFVMQPLRDLGVNVAED
jgi:2-amino-4-hydroxy-6-hydroxymethyldihydropteridine diphosphokinase